VTDRGSPPDASLACPFVAFEDDRDARSTTPDRRHRCFAEVRPAPRAIAHQERYCLSAGFAACPTFIDWARREAAQVRPEPRTTAPEAGLAAAAAAALGPDETARGGAAPTEPQASAMWPRRPGDRDWAAPPPWAAGAGAAGSAAMAGAAAADGPMGGGEAIGAGPARGGETDAGRTTGRPESPPARPPDDALPPTGEAPPFLAGREAPSEAMRPPVPPDRPMPRPTADREPSAASAALEPSTGLAASYPGMSAGPTPEPDDAAVDDQPAMRRFGPAPGRPKAAPPPVRSQPRQRPPVDPDAPAWERPRRFEAYPTLKTRAGLPNLSPLLLALGGIAIAALALFFIPPMLLGLGGDGDDGSPTPSASATASPTARPSPSPSPSPTPLVYVVQSGDTLSKIAAQFGVSLDDLIAANAETVPDPNNIKVGDQIVIPTAPPDEIPNASPSPSPSP
jgi:hypothetical protein